MEPGRIHVKQKNISGISRFLLICCAAAAAVMLPAKMVKTAPADEERTKIKGGTEDKVTALITSMSLEEKILQMFFLTPEALTGEASVTRAGERTQAAYDSFPVGGVIYFAENIESEEQWLEMTAGIQKYSRERIGLPVFIGIDEEGGRVARLANSGVFNGISEIPEMYLIGAGEEEQSAWDTGATIGRYLKERNVNLDFAPVADVYSNPENTVIGTRSFGSDPQTAAQMVAEAVKGFHSQGMLCTLKHFPGHGDTAGDSHTGRVYSNKNKEELKECELIPFEAGIRAGADFVMVGHISLPDLLGSNTPATLSPEIVTGLLREELGFKGIIITDALNMRAVSDYYTSAEAAVLAVKAGADMLLMPEDFQSAYHGVLEAVREGEIQEERIDESVRRIVEMKLTKLEAD